MNRRRKSIKEIVNHYREHFQYQTFLDTRNVERMLERNGHNPKLADKVGEMAIRRGKR